jgi:hypothetical protein
MEELASIDLPCASSKNVRQQAGIAERTGGAAAARLGGLAAVKQVSGCQLPR